MQHATAPQIHSSVSAAQSDLMGLHRAAQASGHCASVSSLSRCTAYSPQRTKCAHNAAWWHASQQMRGCLTGTSFSLVRDGFQIERPLVHSGRRLARMLASFKQIIPPGTFTLPKTPWSGTPSRVIQLVFRAVPPAFSVRRARESSFFECPSLDPCSHTSSTVKNETAPTVTASSFSYRPASPLKSPCSSDTSLISA